VLKVFSGEIKFAFYPLVEKQMTTFKFSAIEYGQLITFNPTTDILKFDDPSTSAGLGSISLVDNNLNFTYGDKAFTLKEVSLGQLTSKNVTFDSGSKLIIGDDQVSTISDDAANELNGGLNSDLLYGMGGNDTLNGGVGFDVMIGGDGADIYMVDDASDQVNENNSYYDSSHLYYDSKDRSQWDVVNSSVSYTLNANVEELILTGKANINGTGNPFGNLLTGNSGNNLLDGGTGADTLRGGDGNDIYILDNFSDQVEETSSLAKGGTDTIRSFSDCTLPANVENLELQDVTGVMYDIDGTGNSLNNKLSGNNDQNILNGLSGADTMDGGEGRDIYYVDNVGDKVEETNNGLTENQIDIVKSTIDYELPANVENLQLMAGANINATGNALNNIFYANVGDNVFDGVSGIDMVSYEYELKYNAANVVDSSAVYAGVIVSLATTGAQSTRGSGKDTLRNIDNLTGSQFNDVLTGNSYANVLNGSGGADRLIGGDGNDTYIVDGADLVVEINPVPTQTDTVMSSVSYILGANIEQLVLTGSTAINGTGNELQNTITGNSGNNFLDGMAGADRLEGGSGDDYYVVDSFDTVIEQSGEGTDTVLADISYMLPTNVENLQLLGSSNLSGTGNKFANVIYANTGSNVLDGVVNESSSSIDTVSYQFGAVAGIRVDLSLTTIQDTGGSGKDTLIHFANLTGSNYDDVLIGTSGDNVLNGLAGNDTVSYQGATAGVKVDLSYSSPQITGGAGTDTLLSIENLTGSTFDDTIIASAANNIIDGGNGIDTVSYAASTVAVTVILTTKDAQNTGGSGMDALRNIENLIGSQYDGDSLTGDAGNNILNGGTGVDTLTGGNGNDTYIVDNLRDLVIETNSAKTQIDTVQSSVNFTLGNNIENLQLTDITSSSISGTGNVLNNSLTGNAASNMLIGGDGNDTLNGGAGKDTLQGDLGADWFSFSLLGDSKVSDPDVISDFSQTQKDKIDLSLPTFYESTFKFIGNAAFGSIAGQLRFATDAGNTLVMGDTDGNGTADFAIQLTGVTTPMVAADFIL
jgi:serralysin